MQIWLKRAYDDPGQADGQRILIDRVWPRGVSKQTLQIDTWLKDVAPSKNLRQWYDHDIEKWSEFKQRYWEELKEGGEAVEELVSRVRQGRVTLVFGARDEQHNNAVALKEFLRNRLSG